MRSFEQGREKSQNLFNQAGFFVKMFDSEICAFECAALLRIPSINKSTGFIHPSHNFKIDLKY